MRNELNLLPENLLIKTNSLDHSEWNYRPGLKWIQQKRFHLALSLMNNNHYDHILEIGYGSGIFMPALTKSYTRLTGIDIHQHNEQVQEILSRFGVPVSLVRASATAMPFQDESFDLIISISAFEFIEDKRKAAQEITRTLRKNGHFIIVTPGNFWLYDLTLKILTGASVKKDYEDKRRHVFPILKEYFEINKAITFPLFPGKAYPVYNAILMNKKE